MMRPGCFHTATLREAWGNRSWASPQQVWQADGIMWLAELLCLPSPQDSGAKETCQISLDTDGGHFSSRRASLHGNLDWKWELSARLISLSFFFKPSHWRLPVGISVGLNDLLLAGNDAWESVSQELKATRRSEDFLTCNEKNDLSATTCLTCCRTMLPWLTRQLLLQRLYVSFLNTNQRCSKMKIKTLHFTIQRLFCYSA